MTDGDTSDDTTEDEDGRDTAHRSIKEILSRTVNENELRELCFDLGIASEDISGDVISVRIVSLLEYAKRHSLMFDLWRWLRANRPNEF